MKEKIWWALLKSDISMDRSMGNHANKVNPGADNFILNFSLRQFILFWFWFHHSIFVLTLIIFPVIFRSLCCCAKLCHSIFENGWAEKPEQKKLVDKREALCIHGLLIQWLIDWMTNLTPIQQPPHGLSPNIPPNGDHNLGNLVNINKGYVNQMVEPRPHGHLGTTFFTSQVGTKIFRFFKITSL